MSGTQPRISTTPGARTPAHSSETYDVVVVGAGFAGLYLLHRLRGLGLRALVLEAADGVGGTWYWNRYPGARCDVHSMFYSYSFSEELEQEWEWSERYPAQPEILSYLEHVADRFDLRRDIRFETRVSAAHFEEAGQRWRVRTEDGGELTAGYCVMATGCLSAGKMPEIEGLEDFEGDSFHTGYWPHEGVDFTGRNVAVIGTGSSGIQTIPVIAEQAAHLTVFQRTPNYSFPAHNRPLGDEEQQRIKREFPRLREQARQSTSGTLSARVPTMSALEADEEEREAVFQDAWEEGSLTAVLGTFTDLLTDAEANETAAEFVRRRIGELVEDPATAELLTPRDYPVGTKRPCLDTGYYATFNRPDVDLVSLRSTPLTRITPAGVATTEAEHAVDSIVFATGFDAMTGALLNIDIRGRGGLTLSEKWAEGPRTYLGLAAAGFPNLFMVTGPGSPSVLSNMIVSIEQHVEWITDFIASMRERGIAGAEATREAEDAWVSHVNEVADATLYPRAPSWYIGANVPGKSRVFMPYAGGVNVYREKCDAVAANGYEGFAWTDGGAAEAVPEGAVTGG